jgi:hypothetical protein
MDTESRTSSTLLAIDNRRRLHKSLKDNPTVQYRPAAASMPATMSGTYSFADVVVAEDANIH